MITILTISTQKFSLNGIPYFKNFMPHVISGLLKIVNVYDTKFELSELGVHTDYSVNGIVYTNVTDLQSALLPVLYTRANLGITDPGTNPYILEYTYEGGDQEITIAENVSILNVFLGEGRILKEGSEYTVSGETLTVIFPLQENDIIYITGLI